MFDEINTEIQSIRVNIYADEVQGIEDTNSSDKWHYIGLIIEEVGNPLLPELLTLRYCGNPDSVSEFYDKNNKLIHWTDIRSANQKHVCKRWFEYVTEPNKTCWDIPLRFTVEASKNTLKFYILGLNSSKLSDAEFDENDDFNSKYNRFFRTAIVYSLKKYYSGKNIIVQNIYHEQGGQENNKYFPWHSIHKIDTEQSNISFNTKEIIFLPKNHTQDERSNVIQLCDTLLGASVTILHGLGGGTRADNKKELVDLYFPLFERLLNSPNNVNSRYQYHRRFGIDFFPKEKTQINDWSRYKNQFYKERSLQYALDQSGQTQMFS